jgi:hypothetical protein
VSAGVPDHICRLLAESLRAWRVGGEVACEPDGTLLLTAGGKRLSIARAAPHLPFSWTVHEGGRSRAATSIAGLLRAVRGAVDPGHRPVRLRIAPLPLPSP